MRFVTRVILYLEKTLHLLFILFYFLTACLSAACAVTPPFDVRTFSVAGLAAWNSLPDYRQDPNHSVDSFHCKLKTFLVLPVYTAH